MKTEDKNIIIFQLLIAIAVVFLLTTVGSQVLTGFNESLSHFNQQACSNALLQVEMINNSSPLKETTINHIINSPGCQSLFSNNTNNS